MNTVLALLSYTIGLMILTQAMPLLFRKEFRNRAHFCLGISAVFSSMWAFSYAVMYSTADAELAALSYRIGAPGWTIGFSTSAIFFNLLFNRVSGKKSRTWVIALLIAVGILFYYAAMRGLIVASDFTPAPWGWRETVDPGSAWVIAYGVFIVAAIANVIARTLVTWRRVRLNKHRMQMRMIGVPFAVLTIPTVIVNYISPLLGVSEVPPVGHLVICCIMFFICESALRYRMLTIDPGYAAEALLFDVSDFVFLTDTAGRVRKAGNAALRLLGTGAESIIGKNIGDISPILSLAEIARNSAAEAAAFTTEIMIADGSAVPVSCSVTPVMDSHNDLMGYLLVMNDLRDIRALELKTEELRKANEYLKVISITDPLTGICNRKKMHEELDREYNRFHRNGSIFSLIMMDLDHFKNVNDTWGHSTGDDVLRRAAARAASVIRKNDIIARWGGEEFLVLCAETRVVDAGRLAERIRAAIDWNDYPQAGRVTASLGVAEISQGMSIDSLVSSADAALYESKANGRNMVTVKSADGRA